jgi:putative ABC transport system permease protein
MFFLGLIVKNLWRQKVRSLLAILGISIGIASIIALGSIANGMEENLISALKSAKADFTIGQANAPAIVLSLIPAVRLKEIRRLAEVAEAHGALIMFSNVNENPYFVVVGADADAFDLAGIRLVQGRVFQTDAENELVLGKVAASTLNVRVDEPVQLDGREFRVAGIYETGNVYEDGGAIMPLKTLQKLKHRSDELTIILVKAQPQADVEKLTEQIETTYKNQLVTLRDLSEYSRNYQGAGLVRVGSWLISLLALVIGGIGVMNTMIMAVFERTREIGILRAVGWRRSRVLRMILGESLLLSLLAAVAGTFLGLSASWLITKLPRAVGLIGPSYTPMLFYEAIAIALVVGLLGGLYPAYRATRILPQEALRYE